MRHTPETDAVFPHAYAFESGAMHPGDAPGLGVDIDEGLAATHPYDPAYLPVNRKLDGMPSHELRNYDVFAVALNHAVA